MLVLLLGDWNLPSPFYLHSIQPLLHQPCSYRKIVSLYFVYVCLQLCLLWLFVLILWNHHSVITSSQVPVCHPVDILSGSGYNLTVFRFSKVNVLFAVSGLTKFILIKVYRVLCITICLVSSPPAGNYLIQRGIN